MLTSRHLGQIYSGYCNATTPATLLHEQASLTGCVAAARKQSALAQAARLKGDSSFVSHQAKAWGSRAAAGAAGAFKLVDVVVGTGIHEGHKVKINSSQGFAHHLGELAAAPTDTGFAGLVTGLAVGLPLAVGAALGTAVTLGGIGVMSLLRGLTGYGFAIADVRQKLLNGASTGAVLGVVVGGIALPSTLVMTGVWMVAVGAARVVTGAAKMAAVGVLYGLGYTVGYACAAVQGRKQPQPATT